MSGSYYSQCPVLIARNPEAAITGVHYKKGVLKNFEKFTGKQLCQSLFFNKDAGAACSFALLLFIATLLKSHFDMGFFCKFAVYLQNTLFKNTSGGLLL